MCASEQHMKQAARHPGMLLGMALVVVAIVALAGCGQTATAHRDMAHGSTTATPHVMGTPDSVIRQGPQLAWQPVAMPPEQVSMPMAVAMSDGDVAYACDAVQPKGDGTTHTWVTRDRGQHWSAGGNIAGLAGATMCHLAVDDNNANVVVATLSTASGGSQPPVFLADASYASFDGGATWRVLGAGEAIGHVASYNGKYYAARLYEACAACPMIGNLAVSSDQMATWTLVGPDLSFGGSWFAVSPLSGSLLISSGQNPDANLARSDDGGAHWSPVSLPVWAQGILAAPQTGAEPWLLCAAATAGPDSTPASTEVTDNHLACSTDGGQTWNERPALHLTNYSPKGFTYPAAAYAVAIADDGAVLATVSDSNAITRLYRLPSGSTTWESLGPLNGIASCAYSTGPGVGVLWQSLISSPNPYLTASYPL